MKIKIPTQTLDKEFKLVEQDITIDGSEYDAKNQEIWYTLRIPDHVYNELLDTAPEYTVEKGFRKSIKLSSIKMILEIYRNYCFEILNRYEMQNQTREKKLFVKFAHGNFKRRCDWTHGYMGESTTSDFQFFVGFKIMEPRHLSGEDASKHVVAYYTLIQHKPLMATSSHDRRDENDLKIGTKLHPLHMNTSQHRAAFEKTHAIIDWTQEREYFLTNVQNKFKDLNKYLNDFLGNLDNDKLQKLMEHTNFKLLN